MAAKPEYIRKFMDLLRWHGLRTITDSIAEALEKIQIESTVPLDEPVAEQDVHWLDAEEMSIAAANLRTFGQDLD